MYNDILEHKSTIILEYNLIINNFATQSYATVSHIPLVPEYLNNIQQNYSTDYLQYYIIIIVLNIIFYNFFIDYKDFS